MVMVMVIIYLSFQLMKLTMPTGRWSSAESLGMSALNSALLKNIIMIFRPLRERSNKLAFLPQSMHPHNQTNPIFTIDRSWSGPELTPDVSELGLTTPESPPPAGYELWACQWVTMMTLLKVVNFRGGDCYRNPAEIEKEKKMLKGRPPPRKINCPLQMPWGTFIRHPRLFVIFSLWGEDTCQMCSNP